MSNTGDAIALTNGVEMVCAGPCPVGTCNNFTWVTRYQYDRLRKEGDTFYCVAGHQQSFTPQREIDAKARRLREAEDHAAEARAAQEAALKAMRKAERTCTWPTCGAVLRSPKMLRQHMVDQHGAPWLTPEVANDEIAQVLNGRDQASVVR